MANTTLCGYVSYGTNVEKNEDDSELYLDCQINLDNNGTESRYNIYENYNELKILKKNINENWGYKASSSYELAFSYLLLQEQGKILYKLKEQNNIELYKLYIEATQFDYLLGLEIIAKELKMDYLFRLDDDTI